MNYYNPYFYSIPITQTPRIGLFSRIFGGGINFGNILNGAQRALNFANQAIPLVKEVKPLIGNAKTMFKVMNEFKKVEKPINSNKSNVQKNNGNTIDKNIPNETYSNGPTFFI